MEETVNPQGNESQSENNNIEAAFDQYMERQANHAGESLLGQQQQGAEQGQPDDAEADGVEDSGDSAQRYKVKVNGEEKEVTLDELIKGYQLESDYRIKTSQLAEQARATQEQYQRAQQLQAHYAQQLQAYQQQLATLQPQPPDPDMIGKDPVAFLRHQQAYQQWQQQMQVVAAEQQRLGEMQALQQAQMQQQTLAQQGELLIKAIPEWADQEKGKAEKAALSSYLVGQGFGHDEVAAVTDHRAVVLARKAMLYDEMIKKTGAVSEKMQNVPPRSPQKPGSGKTATGNRITNSIAALKKSGSVDDAANAFAAMLAQ